MVRDAAIFAAEAHKGQVRKGTNIPYITHPLEAAVIVSTMTNDEEMISAAVLHDVVEDAGVRRDELIARFGVHVAELVMCESEDKSKTWEERKGAAISRVAKSSREVKILTLADKLSNMRSTAKDYLMIGDSIWDRFNEKRKDRQAWYYLGMINALEELHDYDYYKEYVSLCRLVFGNLPDSCGKNS